MRLAIIDVTGGIAQKGGKREGLSRREDGSMDWEKFYQPDMVEHDLPIDGAQQSINILAAQNYQIIYITTEKQSMRFARWNWLESNGFIGDDYQLLCQPDIIPRIKGVTWKANIANALVQLYQPQHLILVDDENEKLEAMIEATRLWVVGFDAYLALNQIESVRKLLAVGEQIRPIEIPDRSEEKRVDRERAVNWAQEILALGSNLAILDTETTGLDRKFDQPVEIAVIDGNGKALLNCRVKPGIDVTEKAEEIHGISNEVARNGEDWAIVFVKLVEVLKGKQLVIYNALFDLDMIGNALNWYGLGLGRGLREIFGYEKAHDAMIRYADYTGDWNSRKGNYKFQPLPGGDHSALGDCRATLELIKKMAEG